MNIMFLFAIVIVGVAAGSVSLKSYEGLQYLGEDQEGVQSFRTSSPSRYYISVDKATWTDAERYCYTYSDGALASIETAEEDKLIHDLLKGNSKIGQNVWTSGVYDTRGEVWRWDTTGGRVQYSNWGENEPSAINPSFGIATKSWDRFNFDWSVHPENTLNHFICEVPSRNDTPVPCYRETDLVIVLDGSGSITPPDFEIGKEFSALLAGAFLSPSRVSFIVYSSTSTVIFTLNSGLSPSDIQSAIKNAYHPRAGTSTHLAIDQAIADLVNNPEGIPRKLVVITDGVSAIPSATILSSKNAKANNIVAYSVGIGNYNANELLAIAGDKAEHVFTVDTFDSLLQLIAPVCIRVCQA